MYFFIICPTTFLFAEKLGALQIIIAASALFYWELLEKNGSYRISNHKFPIPPDAMHLYGGDTIGYRNKRRKDYKL